MDEATLIRRAQAGDTAAFEGLLNDRYDMLYRVAYKWCGNRADADDITQQACIKLARNLSQFRFESAFNTWLYRLVINCAKDWYKSQQRYISEGMIGEEPAGPDDTGESAAYLRQVLAVLEQMAEGFKETVLLVHAEGLTHAEAATILSVKESTISWRLHEIRKQLQTLHQPAPSAREVLP